ncbi:hypothetical protein DAPPUDRAFT_332404 [Daphnia pulex]|uniref:Uncharacterized protein n=1 Tax=Daphnia pulex TaxID=6669 RepID=E9HPV9_DAPPU|nr:hypothetical protein DAPPUDRAFT_332404 [Daphnia pulex]|eukprot:EFX66232.1 hypothetical protein DAPPUDRAFT_332404 [Daphnia pulex]
MWFFAEKRGTIDNHNFQLHRAVEVKNSERPSETSYRKGERFDVEIVEPYLHRVEKVSVAENFTIEEPIIHQSSSCFDVNWEPDFDSMDESLFQQQTVNVALENPIKIGDASTVVADEFREYIIYIDMRCGVLYQAKDICGINGTLIGPNYPPENFMMSLLQEGPNAGKVTVILKTSRNTTSPSVSELLTRQNMSALGRV